MASGPGFRSLILRGSVDSLSHMNVNAIGVWVIIFRVPGFISLFGKKGVGRISVLIGKDFFKCEASNKKKENRRIPVKKALV